MYISILNLGGPRTHVMLYLRKGILSVKLASTSGHRHSRLNQNKPYAFRLSFLGPLREDKVCCKTYKKIMVSQTKIEICKKKVFSIHFH